MVKIEKRLENCNFIKTVLMILIVFYHSILFWKGNWFVSVTPPPKFCSEHFAYLADWLNSFHVYGFALVSGYIFRYLKIEKGKYNRFADFTRNKALRLLIPYVFVSAVWVVPVSLYFNLIDLKDIFSKYILGTSPSQLWFLLMLFWVFIIAFFMSGFWENHLVLGFFSVVLCFGAGLIGPAVLPNVFMIWTALRYVLYFWIGFQLRKYSNCFLWHIPPIIYIISDIAIFSLSRFIPTSGGIIFKLIDIFANTALNILGSIMIFMVLQRLSSNRIKENKIFNFINKKSMTVYLFHQQIIYFSIVLLNGAVNPWLHALINFVVALILSLALSAILQKYSITRYLIGEK